MDPQHYLHKDTAAFLAWLMHLVNKDVPADLCGHGLALSSRLRSGKVRFACYGTGEDGANFLLAQNKLPLTVDQSLTIPETTELLQRPGVYFNNHLPGADAGNHASLVYKGMKLSAQEIQLKVEEAIIVLLYRWVLHEAVK